MTAAAITRLRASGFTLAADGDRLKVTGPMLTDAQRGWLAEHKPAILQALDAEHEFAERASIIHEGHTIAVATDGKPLIVPICTISRSEAEARARGEVAQHPIVAAALSEFPGATIMAKAFGEDSLISRTDLVPVAGNSLVFPTDMTTPWQSSGGVQAFWTSEASAITQSKPVLQNVTVRLDKLAVLIPVTEELLEDAPAMGAVVSRLAGEKIDFKVSDAIAYGTGAGQPLGFMNSPVLISQAAETSQVADTIVAANVAKMSSRLPVQSRRNSVWLIHPDAEPQLPLMTLGDQPVYLPPGGFRDTPFGSLLGRPVIPHQVCQTVGDLGDIMLIDLSQYLMAVKAGGVRAQTSIHLWFDQDAVAFKFTLRVAGQPWWSEVTTAKNGTFTQSPFISLAARA